MRRSPPIDDLHRGCDEVVAKIDRGDDLHLGRQGEERRNRDAPVIEQQCLLDPAFVLSRALGDRSRRKRSEIVPVPQGQWTEPNSSRIDWQLRGVLGLPIFPEGGQIEPAGTKRRGATLLSVQHAIGPVVPRGSIVHRNEAPTAGLVDEPQLDAAPPSPTAIGPPVRDP